MRVDRVIVFLGGDGWRWKFRSKNGANICTSGEPFMQKSNAVRAAREFARRLTARVAVVEADGAEYSTL